MYTALDIAAGTAITDQEVSSDQHHDEQAGAHGYCCLNCGEMLEYREEAVSNTGAFVHSAVDCINAGNVSNAHRVAQELTAKELYNCIGVGIDQINIERRIGTESDYLVADVAIGPPVRVAVEVVYDGQVHLRRRLRTMEAAGYAGAIVVVTGGKRSASRIDGYLAQVGGGRVGRCDPATRSVDVGTLIRPDQIDLDSVPAGQLPAYLA